MPDGTYRAVVRIQNAKLNRSYVFGSFPTEMDAHLAAEEKRRAVLASVK